MEGKRGEGGLSKIGGSETMVGLHRLHAAHFFTTLKHDPVYDYLFIYLCIYLCYLFIYVFIEGL